MHCFVYKKHPNKVSPRFLLVKKKHSNAVIAHFLPFPRVLHLMWWWQQKSNSTQRERMHVGQLHLPHENKASTQKKRRGSDIGKHSAATQHCEIPTHIIYPSDNKNRLKEDTEIVCFQWDKHKASIVTDLHWCASCLDSLRVVTEECNL